MNEDKYPKTFASFLIKFCETYPYIFVRIGRDAIIASYVIRLMDFNVNPPVYVDIPVSETDFQRSLLDDDELLKEAVRSAYKKLIKERNKSGWETAS